MKARNITTTVGYGLEDLSGLPFPLPVIQGKKLKKKCCKKFKKGKRCKKCPGNKHK